MKKKMFSLSLICFTGACFLFSGIAIPAHAFTLGYDSGWAAREITFNTDLTNCPSNVAGNIDAAIRVWNTAPTSHLVLKIGSSVVVSPSSLLAGSVNGTPIITCDTSFSSTIPSADPNFVSGYGFFRASGGSINYGGVILNAQSGTSGYVGGKSDILLQVLIAHEIGHVLGLGHAEESNALMYYSISGKEELNLSQDDIDGITYLYPRDELFGKQIMGCGLLKNSTPPSSQSPSPYIVLTLLTLPLLLAALGRRSRSSKVGAVYES